MRWGLGPLLDGKAVEPEAITLRRWKDGTAIGYTNLIPHFQNTFGAPYYVIHRAHFHESMQKLAKKLGVKVLTASKVMEYDMNAPSLTLQDGSSHGGDLIVAADGEWQTPEKLKLPRSNRVISKELILVRAKQY